MSKDLFDDSTMSFGDHLEALRVHLWRALIGLLIGVIASLAYSKPLIDMIRAPIDQALASHGQPVEEGTEQSFFEIVQAWFSDETTNDQPSDATNPPVATEGVELQLNVVALMREMHTVDPEHYPAPPANAAPRMVSVLLPAASVEKLGGGPEPLKPITIEIQEAFLTYLKVALIAGLVLSSPWVFYQIWLFVAAGLYPHERHWVYRFLPMSVGLFLGGALFCFFAVIPIVVQFLLEFNLWLGLTPQIRMSTWISFAVTLPLMFGLSFQLPLVMLFLERISIFEANDYREKRRIAILVIAIISMLLTPADPTSMLMMMLPLLGLYEVGILLCGAKGPSADPFPAQAAS